MWINTKFQIPIKKNIPEVKTKMENNEFILDIPSIPEENLPKVTVITLIYKDRYKFFPLCRVASATVLVDQHSCHGVSQVTVPNPYPGTGYTVQETKQQVFLRYKIINEAFFLFPPPRAEGTHLHLVRRV